MSFDLRVHIKEAKTGKVVKVQPYKRHVSSTGVLYERPAGYFYTEGGELVKSPEMEAEKHAKALEAEKAQEKEKPFTVKKA